jgi:ATP-dependent phosphofructokinase / diphosphate-dependent phosphofructokinase
MTGSTKRIGLLTSGGDCPGLNAVIRAVVKCATHRGWEVYGIPYGTSGFASVQQGNCHGQDLKLQEHGYDIPGFLKGLDILQFLSGSILGALNRGSPGDPTFSQQILQGYDRLQLDALIAIGGDGSLDIIDDLAQKGAWKWIAIPKTIDNDVPFTEQSLGFDTAVNTVTKAVYDLTFTAASHDRVMVVQVMGRDAGHLALHSGIAGGADVILIPEITPILTNQLIDHVCQHIAQIRRTQRQFALVVMSEGIRNHQGEKSTEIGEVFAQAIRTHGQKLCDTGEPEFCVLDQVSIRATTLGHIQRSGTPSSFDRLLAAAFGKHAIDLIAAQTYNQMVIWRNGTVAHQPLDRVIPLIKQRHITNQCTSPVDPEGFLVETARDLRICLSP